MTRSALQVAVLLALVAVLVVPAAAGVAIGQEANATEASNATETATPAGPYTLEELRRGGTQVENAPSSTRMLPNGEFVYLRTHPVGVFASEWEYLNAGSTYNGDDLTFLAVHNGKAEPLNATVVVTYWQQDTREVQTENGVVSEPYAANQTVDRTAITIEPGYDLNNVTMRSHFEDTYRVTAWLEMDGEPVEGVRWTFRHQTNQASSTVPFGDEWADFLAWFMPRFLLGSSIAVVGGVSIAYRYVTRAVVSAEKGVPYWLFLSGVAIVVALLGFYQQVVAAIVAAPVLLNVPIFALAFVTAATYFDSSKTARIEDPHITDVVDPMGNDAPDIAGERGATYRYTEGEDAVAFVKQGSSRSGSVMSALARYFTGPAWISSSEWKTAFRYDGPEDTKIYADPIEDEDGNEHIIKFTPASWKWALPAFCYVGDPDDDAPAELSLKGVAVALGLVAFPLAVGYGIGSYLFVAEWAIYTTAAATGGLGLAAATYRPVPPQAELNAAPPHASRAKAARLVELDERKKLDTFAEISAAVAEFDAENWEHTMGVVESYRRRTRELWESLHDLSENGHRGASKPPELTEAETDD